MNTQQEMEDRLWDYIDGLSTATEHSEIERLLAGDIEWKGKYRELMETHRLLLNTELQAPSMRFTRNVMEEIVKYHVAPATKTYINKHIIRGIGAFFLTMILGFLVYVFAQVHWTGSGPDTQSTHPSLPSFDWMKLASKTYVDILIMIGIILGLMLFDRWLEQKRKAAL